MISIRDQLKKALPLSDPRVIAAIRRVRNLRTLPSMLNPRHRAQLVKECHDCRDFAGLFAFARDRLSGGALQNFEEISDAIEYIGQHQPRSFCEIGTANGGTNLLMMRNLPSLRTIIALDLYITNRWMLRLLSLPGQDQHFLNGLSQDARTLKRVRAALGGESLDLLFIDGDHSFKGVSGDFMLYSPLVKEGGLIMFHDIVPDHATRFGRDGINRTGDVPAFWRMLKPHFPHREFVRDPDQDGLGLGIIHWSKALKLPDFTPGR
jgi:predicted O-methyltransferase YrrM